MNNKVEGRLITNAEKSFSKNTVSVPSNADWKRENATTLTSEHSTSSMYQRATFDFTEQLVQTHQKCKKTGNTSDSTYSFDDFDNSELLKRAAAKLQELNGDDAMSEQHKKPAVKRVQSPAIRK